MINKIFVFVIIILIIIIINIIPKKEKYEERQLKYIHKELITILEVFKKIMDIQLQLMMFWEHCN